MEEYLNIEHHPMMGLNNKICDNPIAYCKGKRVYLSEKDIEKKKCLAKPTVDMIGTCRCNWLIFN